MLPQSSLFGEQNLLPFDGEVFYFPGFFNKQESDAYLNALQQDVPWKQEPIKIFGKEVMQPRLTAWCGDRAYSYSGITMQPRPFSGSLLAIKQQVEAQAGLVFNTALLNLYRNGSDSMGWHRDNEKELGLNPTIASVSFGAERTFQLRHYTTKQHLKNIVLQHGSLLLMQGATQPNWEHHVPKTTKPLGPRINMTFRVVL